MLTAILLDWLRHALTSIATGLIMDGLHTLSPTRIAAGGVVGVVSLGLSAFDKVTVGKLKAVSLPAENWTINDKR